MRVVPGAVVDTWVAHNLAPPVAHIAEPMVAVHIRVAVRIAGRRIAVVVVAVDMRERRVVDTHLAGRIVAPHIVVRVPAYIAVRRARVRDDTPVPVDMPVVAGDRTPVAAPGDIVIPVRAYIAARGPDGIAVPVAYMMAQAQTSGPFRMMVATRRPPALDMQALRPQPALRFARTALPPLSLSDLNLPRHPREFWQRAQCRE